jgi:hypothetical protein
LINLLNQKIKLGGPVGLAKNKQQLLLYKKDLQKLVKMMKDGSLSKA